MLDFLGKLVRVKNKVLHSKLTPIPGSKYSGHGTIEITWYSDQTQEIQLSIKDSKTPSGTKIEYKVDGTIIARAASINGAANTYKRFDQHKYDFSVGSITEIGVNGRTNYIGELYDLKS